MSKYRLILSATDSIWRPCCIPDATKIICESCMQKYSALTLSHIKECYEDPDPILPCEIKGCGNLGTYSLRDINIYLARNIRLECIKDWISLKMI